MQHRVVPPSNDGAGQLTAFLTSLLKAVESTPNAAVLYTLTTGKHGRATDAYSAENQFVADRMAEIESITPVREENHSANGAPSGSGAQPVVGRLRTAYADLVGLMP